jgi:hypothetical protein
MRLIRAVAQLLAYETKRSEIRASTAEAYFSVKALVDQMQQDQQMQERSGLRRRMGGRLGDRSVACGSRLLRRLHKLHLL